LGEFLAELARVVRADADDARRQVTNVWARPLDERVRSGRAIANLRIAERQPDGMLALNCPRNESRFREGDVLLLSRGDPFFEPRFLVTLEVDEETDLLVSTEEPGVTVFDFVAQPDGWVLDEGFLDFSDQVLAALDEAADTAVGRERILPLLTGQSRPQVDGDRFTHAIDRAKGWGLNEQQAEALALAHASDLAYLIQGPPGTGKTLVLARLAQLCAEDGERVLLTAFTHRAIANALNKLHELSLRHDDTPATVVKIGHPARASDLLVENFPTFDSSPLPDLSGGYIVGATPFATRSSRLRGAAFDTVIFDEASQITLPLAIMAMLSARRFIFVGDHRQLPPVLPTRYGDEVLRDSIFAALVDRGFDTMLDTTYRLNAELAAWPSAKFYNGQLQSAPDAAGRRLVLRRPPQRFSAILDHAEPKVFVDLGHRNATTRSDVEASLAVDLVLELLACGLAAEEIGVVAPYRAQGRAIRGLLRKALRGQPERRRAVVVDTVERMQGQERELIIVSLTTSNATFASALGDFLFQAERLNVAVTRPRSKLIILGSRYLLEARAADEAQQEALDLLRDFLAHCAVRVIDDHG
jgi:DNA replication ATP-dependent helicase Dna2